jgi:RND family efflux transporter MFP subunit
MSADLSPPATSPATVVTIPGPTLFPPLSGPSVSILPATADPPLASPSRTARLRRVALRFWPLGVLAVGVIAAVVVFGRPSGKGADFITARVVRGNLDVTVTERGELDSINSITVRCDVEGEKSKLVDIVAEGTHVKKGQEVGRFDTDELKKLYAQQEVKWKTAEGKWKSARGDLAVQKNKEESEIDKAELAWKLAKIDLDKYKERDYAGLLSKQQGMLGLKKKELKEAKDNLEFTKGLVIKGFAPLDQLRIQELLVETKQFEVEQGEAELGALKEFERRRKITELEGKDREAERELKRVKESQKAATEKAQSELDAAAITEKLEKQTLDRIQAQMDRCVLKAPQDGIVVYFKRYYDESSRIQPGAVVFFQQPIFTLPDLENMKVKVKIHESVIKKISTGLTASLLIDALPPNHPPLNGTVKTVGTLANSEGWRQTVKEYMVEIGIDDLPTSAGLKPGMTAQVRIHVKTVPDALLVPVQAVTEYEGKPVCYVKTGRSTERRPVEVGEGNDQFIQIVSGLTEGEEVALDARSRAAAEVKAGAK